MGGDSSMLAGGEEEEDGKQGTAWGAAVACWLGVKRRRW